MKRSWLAASAVVLAAVVVGGALVLKPGKDAGSSKAERKTPVYAVPAELRPLNVELKALGSVSPLNTVEVRSRVEGELDAVNFSEGQKVVAGQVLARVDPRPYRAALTAAEGDRDQSQAQLRQAERELEMHQRLAAGGFAPKVKLDQQQAVVDQHKGAIAGHRGRIDDARLNLAFTEIRAPITGRIGLRGIDRGNMVRAGDDTILATIVQMSPISVVFTLPETQLQEVRQALRAGALTAEAWDRDERAVLATGQVTTLDNQIDAASGTVKLRAQFANTDEQLFPNQFVNVRLRLRTDPNALMIPEAAIQRGAKGLYVYVVDAEGKSRRRDVRVGAGDGERVSLLSGVKAGERVVLEGFDGLKDGEAVEIISRPAGGA